MRTNASWILHTQHLPQRAMQQRLRGSASTATGLAGSERAGRLAVSASPCALQRGSALGAGEGRSAEGMALLCPDYYCTYSYLAPR